MNNNGLLLIFSGPSGAGKGTVLKELLNDNDNMKLSVSATTRTPREGECHGSGIIKFFCYVHDQTQIVLN